MKQKIIKIGNSQGIIIPKEALDAAGIQQGKEVYITPDPNAGTLIISERLPNENYAHNTRLKNSSQKILEQYREAWKNLAKIDEK